VTNTLTQQSPIRFQLGLPWASQTDTPALALKMGPSTHQSSGKVSQLGQLYLEFSFVGAGAQCKDIENQARSINHAALYSGFKIAFLNRRNSLIKNNQVYSFGFNRPSNLLSLT